MVRSSYTARVSLEEAMFRAIVRSVAILLAGPALLAGQRPIQRPALPAAQSAAPYFPERFDWQHKKPGEVGMDAARLDDAGKAASAAQNPAPKDLDLMLATSFGRTEPFDTPIGPVQMP